jgi:protein-disulfide isomerase
MPTLSPHVTAKDHTEGPATAPVTLVEFGDYQCPSCGDAFPIVKKLQKHFGDKLRLVFRHFPLEMHPYAEHAAETAEFAAAHGKFWQMHDLLYQHQSNLSDANLLKLAKQLDLSTDDLAKALEASTYAAPVQADIASGDKSGVTGTPTFYINGQLCEEDYDYETLVAAIEEELK